MVDSFAAGLPSFNRNADRDESYGLWPPMTNVGAPNERPGHARVTRRLTLRFDEFGWESLEAQARHQDETLDELLAHACAYFDSELDSNRLVAQAPGFKPSGQGTPRKVLLDLARDRWEGLQREAGRQGIPLERLLEHAALVHLADVDSGRVANGILRRAEQGEDEA
jgi:hypothetical protein